MNRGQLDVFEKLVGQIQSIYEELSVLSKKSPNDAVNKFKLTFVNTMLAESNQLLGDKYRPLADFAEAHSRLDFEGAVTVTDLDLLAGIVGHGVGSLDDLPRVGVDVARRGAAVEGWSLAYCYDEIVARFG